MNLLLIGIGLAMDAFAVSVTSGITIHKMKLKHALRIAFFFGTFQALMPFIGWHLGRIASEPVKEYDHWIAFVLLTAIGGKMIWEAVHGDKNEEERKDPLNVYVLFMLAIATSIDALAVGVSFSLLGLKILMPVVVIGAVTFLMSIAGVYIGDHFGKRASSDLMEILGGIILIGIGSKILLSQIVFG
jgi:putative Mn2+ efflux pump MntP